jgi:dephospho-CoA kinase
LTGNIACGKSAVEALLRERGIPVIDADQVARDVVAPGQPTLEAITARFGTELLQADGSLDRAALGGIVFADEAARRDLEALTHPPIIAETLRRVAGLAAAGHELAVVSAALMVESGSYAGYAGLLVVTCDQQVQLQRLTDRDSLSREDALARVDSQLSQQNKASYADAVIDNSGSPADLEWRVVQWLESLNTA